MREFRIFSLHSLIRPASICQTCNWICSTAREGVPHAFRIRSCQIFSSCMYAPILLRVALTISLEISLQQREVYPILAASIRVVPSQQKGSYSGIFSRSIFFFGKECEGVDCPEREICDEGAARLIIICTSFGGIIPIIISRDFPRSRRA